MNNRLKQIRKSLKLSQKEFGKRLGITDAAISKIEKKVNSVSERLIHAICSEFNVNENWLRYGSGEMFNPVSYSNNLVDKIAVEYNLDEFQKKFIQGYLNLSAQHKDIVKDFLDKLYTETSEYSEPVKEKPSKFDDVPTDQLIKEADEIDEELAKRELSVSAKYSNTRNKSI